MNKISNYLHHAKSEMVYEKELFEKYVNKNLHGNKGGIYNGE